MNTSRRENSNGHNTVTNRIEFFYNKSYNATQVELWEEFKK